MPYKDVETRRAAQGKNTAGRRLRMYGVSPEQYDEMYDEQGGRCAICRQFERRMRHGKPTSLCVDHDHETGRVRGLLCSDCNVMLARGQDDPVLLRAAADYLEVHGV